MMKIVKLDYKSEIHLNKYFIQISHISNHISFLEKISEKPSFVVYKDLDIISDFLPETLTAKFLIENLDNLDENLINKQLEKILKLKAFL